MKLRIKPVWLLVYLLLVSGLLRLGFWQLERAEQKRVFLQQQNQSASGEPLHLNQQPSISLADSEQRMAVAEGQYDNQHHLLIDNQIVDGKPGYWVLTPFVLNGEKRAVLVNRGWVAMTGDRRVLPDVRVTQPVNQIGGRIYHFQEPGIKLSGGGQPGQNWPAVVQYVDTKLLAEQLGYTLADFQIELEATAAEGFLRRWQHQVTISPEKHQAYAVQWFGLAVTLSGLFLWLSLKKSS